MTVYSLFIQPFYDTFNEEYRHIITINKQPDGALGAYVKRIAFPQLSSYKGFGNSGGMGSGNGCNLCVYAIKNIDDGCCGNSGGVVSDLLCPENVDNLINFLLENNYTINKDITDIMNNDKIYVNNGKKLLFYINY